MVKESQREAWLLEAFKWNHAWKSPWKFCAKDPDAWAGTYFFGDWAMLEQTWAMWQGLA